MAEAASEKPALLGGNGATIDKEGKLEKQSRHLGIWRKRVFVLCKNWLFSFKDNDAKSKPINSEKATETIDLRVFSSVKSSADRTNKPHSFDVYSSDSTFSMVADSEKEKEDWIRAIGKAIVMSHKKEEVAEEADESSEYSSSLDVLPTKGDK